MENIGFKLTIISVITAFILLVMVLSILLTSYRVDKNKPEDDISAELVTAEVIDRRKSTVLIKNVVITDYYIKAEYKGVKTEFKSKALYDSVEIGSSIDVYLIESKEQGYRLELEYN